MSADASSSSASVLGKRKSPHKSADGDDEGAASGEAFVLDEKCAAMTVEQYMRFFLEEMIGQAQECVDEAIDAVSLLYKQQREELQEYRHQQRVEQAAKHKAARKRVWDLDLTVIETAEGNEDLMGTSFHLCPRQSRDRFSGMCKIGRSTGEEFKGAKGISLAKDLSVSTWHGKFTSVWGTIYYTDLNTKNGSRHNGVRVEKDTPVALSNGDTITVGDTTLRVQLVPAVVEDDDDADLAGIGAAAASSSSSAAASSAAGGAAASSSSSSAAAAVAPAAAAPAAKTTRATRAAARGAAEE